MSWLSMVLRSHNLGRGSAIEEEGQTGRLKMPMSTRLRGMRTPLVHFTKMTPFQYVKLFVLLWQPKRARVFRECSRVLSWEEAGRWQCWDKRGVGLLVGVEVASRLRLLPSLKMWSTRVER